MTSFHYRISPLCCLIILVSALIGCRKPQEATSVSDETKTPSATAKTTPVLSPTAIQDHNRAVATMGQFDYDDAHNRFQSIVEQYPNWVDANVDWAIAKLNRRRPNDVDDAARLLDQAIEADDANLRAKYCRALLYLYEAEPQQARQLFQAVAAADSHDAYAVYYVGQCDFELGDYPAALENFRKAQSIDPYLRSAYYGAFQASQRLKQMTDAKEFLNQFQKLKDNPQARLAEMKYSRMGPKASVTAYAGSTPLAPTLPKGPLFQSPVELTITADSSTKWQGKSPDSSQTPNVTVCDIDANGTPDLFIAGGLESGNAVLLSQPTPAESGKPSYRLATEHPLAKIQHVNAALWGDIDNDGLNDVFLCITGPNQLWRQSAAGEWSDVSNSAQITPSEQQSIDGAMFDADHDGDLDVFVINADAANQLYSNNLDGTFRTLADEHLPPTENASKGIAIGDVDGDRDADIFVLNQHPPHQLLLNDRLWSYTAAAKSDALCQSDIAAVVAADLDSDGATELITATSSGIHSWARDTQGEWVATTIATGIQHATTQLAVQDIDGDGRLDVLAAGKTGWSVCSTDQSQPSFAQEWDSAEGSWTLLAQGTQGWGLVSVTPNKPPQYSAPGPGRFQFVEVQFTGKEAKADQMRSNRSGIGVQATVRVGTQWTSIPTFRDVSGPGQNRQPTVIGLAGAPAADFIRLLWPDGLLQTELELTSTQPYTLEETQRQVSSCPVLFAWNGTAFEFVTDVLGVGGMGFNLGFGEYAQPRPWENLLLPEGLPVTNDQHFRLKIGEPMEEACYLDAVKLVAYDLPPHWQIVMDERQGTSDPVPTGKPLFFQSEVQPVDAVDAEGNDILDRILDRDGRPALPGALDHRFLGRTASPHSVTIRFRQPIKVETPVDSDRLDLALLIDGWIEYPYSQTMFAAWQAQAAYDPPRLEARRGPDAAWKTVYEGFGYPAGMPRRMALPLLPQSLPQGTTELRITTNMEIYWDRVSLARLAACPDAKIRELQLVAATVEEVGFPIRHHSPERKPRFDYRHRSPLWDTRHQAGFYTQFGGCLPLVQHVDDAVAIIGPGEEVDLSFADDTPPLVNGWTRRFVLESHGWCKDMDLYTQHGEQLEPLPMRPAGTPSSERESLHQKFNTRYRAGP